MIATLLVGLAVGGILQVRSAGCPTPSFGSAALCSTGHGPQGIAVCDLNRDGQADLLVSNILVNYSDYCVGEATISVLLGRGDGTFEPSVEYAAGIQPRGIAAQDFNHDGNQDVVVACLACDVVAVFLGNGDGTLRPRVEFAAGNTPMGVAVADFNTDGHLDLGVTDYVANGGGTQIAVLLGNGDGTFQAPAQFSSGCCDPETIVAADLDEDGVIDLVVGNNFTDNVMRLKGNGDGSFQAPVSLSVSGIHPYGIATGDFDHDGHLDLAVTGGGAQQLLILRGLGNGSFTTAGSIPQSGSPFSIAVSDVTQDGHEDLLVSLGGANEVVALAGNGDGTFSPAVTIAVGNAPQFVVVADFNGDASPDLATPLLYDDQVLVRLNECVPLYVIAAGTARGCPGTEVVVPVTTQGTRTLGTIQFSMHWDPAVATFVAVEQIGLPGMTYAENFSGETAAGTLTVSWEDPNLAGTVVPDGTTLFAVRFTVNGPLGATSAVTIDGTPVAIEITEPNLEVLTVEPLAGEVGILSTLSIAGRVLYYPGSPAVPGVDLHLTGDATQTVPSGADGAYVHTVNACGDYLVTPSMTSDSPIAAGVTMLDASLMRRHVLRIQALDSPFKLLAADVSGSESISTLDIRLVKQLVLGLRSDFPAGLWRFIRSDYTFPDPTAPWAPESTRSYADLGTDMAGQDYSAVKLGDVNGSWTAGGGGGLMSVQGSRAGIGLQSAHKHASLRVGSQTVAPKTDVKIPVTARDLTRMTSSQFTLRWDPKVLRYNGVSGFGLPGGGLEDFGIARVGQGLLTFGWDDPAARGVNVKHADLFWVSFAVVGGSGSSTAVSITGSPTLQEIALDFVPVAVATESGLIQVAREKTPGRPVAGAQQDK